MPLSKSLIIFICIGIASAQIPSLGWCPDYQPISKFDINRFLGSWHEAERYFTVTEVGSRCATTTYEKTPDGRVQVSSEVKNAFTGLKRVMEGTLSLIGREGEGMMNVKYSSAPLPYDVQYSVLDTDYDSFAVVWSCSGIGPINTQNVWILTRERLAPSATVQKAYAVLDKFKLSRAFFVKTNQEDCSITPLPVARSPASTAKSTTDKKEKTNRAENVNTSVEFQESTRDGKAAAETIETPQEITETAKSPVSVPELILTQPEADSKPEEESNKYEATNFEKAT